MFAIQIINWGQCQGKGKTAIDQEEAVAIMVEKYERNARSIESALRRKRRQMSNHVENIGSQVDEVIDQLNQIESLLSNIMSSELTAVLSALVPKVVVDFKRTKSGRKMSRPARVRLFFQGESELIAPKIVVAPRGTKFPKGNRGDCHGIETLWRRLFDDRANAGS